MIGLPDARIEYLSQRTLLVEYRRLRRQARLTIIAIGAGGVLAGIAFTVAAVGITGALSL